MLTKIWIMHPESECLFIGTQNDLCGGDGLCEEIGPCVSGEQREVEGLLFAQGWSVSEIARIKIHLNKPSLYMIGLADGGMFAGPNPDLWEILTDYPPEQVHGQPVFVFDDQGNRTHRWHWGRGEWVELAKR